MTAVLVPNVVPGLKSGFASPVFDSQATFRAIMTTIAYAGRAVTLARTPESPDGLQPAATALCLTLADLDTTLWLDDGAATPEALAYLRFHCGAPIAREHHTADFALITHPLAMPRLATFKAGHAEYPDRSATLILQVPSLTSGPITNWSGPGINGTSDVAIEGLPDWFWEDWNLNRELYPMGIDVIFTSAAALIGLPRSIRVEQ